MEYRPLAQTGIDVSVVGFGAWGLGGDRGVIAAYGAQSNKTSERAVKRAWEKGVNFFDTANIYGDGHSERLLGRILQGDRHRCVLATKGGFVDSSGKQDFSPRHLTRTLEESLRRLRTDFVDIFQMHSPRALTPRFFETVAHWASQKKKPAESGPWEFPWSILGMPWPCRGTWV